MIKDFEESLPAILKLAYCQEWNDTFAITGTGIKQS
jgi:hypothetical protein